MVLLLPPAPAALVLFGRAFAIFSFWSAAARRRMAVLGPPGGVGEEGRATLAPEAAAPAPLMGEEGRGEDCDATISMSANCSYSVTSVGLAASARAHCSIAIRRRLQCWHLAINAPASRVRHGRRKPRNALRQGGAPRDQPGHCHRKKNN